MAEWDFALEIDRRRGAPVSRQIASAIADGIARGRFRPGDRIAGSRTLARSLRVHRQTVVTAIDELVAEGWLVTRRASGTFVAPQPPDLRRRRPAAVRLEAPGRMAIDLADAPAPELPASFPRGTIFLSGSRPDTRLLPADLIGRAYRRALRVYGSSLLSYGDPAGLPRLRTALASMLSKARALTADPAAILVTRGSQMALALTARALIRPGDLVAVEHPGYRPAWETFRLSGAEIVPVRVDDQGLDVAALDALTRRRRVRALYLTPHHQFPTTVTLGAARRAGLLQLAAERRFAIIEDDYDHEFHYEGRPVLPLASADTAGVVVYVGTWSKVLAPALRLGFVVAPPDLIRRLIAYRSLLDLQGDTVLECALAELLEEGLIQRHVRKVRRIYQARRDYFVAQLRRQLGSFLTFTEPTGGTAVWVRTRDANSIEKWAVRARDRGVSFEEGRAFTIGAAPIAAARLGFACSSEAELGVAVSRLAAAAR